MANITLFLGAGASVSYDLPTTKEFLDRLRGENQTTDDQILQTLLDCPKFSDVEYLLEAIKNIREFQDSVGENYYEWLAERRNIKISLMNNSTSYGDFLEGLVNVERMVQKEMFRAYRLNTKNYRTALNKTLGPIISFLKSRSDRISVFTTNYDRAIEEYAAIWNNEYTVVDGFKRDGTRFTFQPKVFDENEVTLTRRIFLYKLHGSLNWIKKNDTIQRLDIEPIFDDDDDDYCQKMLIYPTLLPKDDLHKTPYSILFDRFKADMEKTDMLIVIGHSFRDREIRDKIREQFVRGKKKLFILSPTGKSDYDQMLSENPTSESTDKLNLNGHTRILEEKLTPETVEKIVLEIGSFLADKTDTKP